MKKMRQEELIKKVRLYLQRAEQDSLIENYPLDKKGYWRIMGGSRGTYGRRHREPMKDVIRGGFIDAVAYAVQQREFYADWCSWDDPSNCNHGKVEKIEIHKLKNKGLAEVIKNSQTNLFQSSRTE